MTKKFLGAIVLAGWASLAPVQAQSFPFPIPGMGSGGPTINLPISIGGQTLNIPIPIPIPTEWGRGLPGSQAPTTETRNREAPPVAQNPLPGQPLADYGVIQASGRPARYERSALPVRLYSLDSRYLGVTQRAAQVWNDVGQRNLGLNFFTVVTNPADAQLSIDWNGNGVPSNAAGATAMKSNGGRLVITGIGLRGAQDLTDQAQAEVLGHELGHVLGLDHSNQPDDLMYHHRRVRPQGEVGLTPRDLQMLSWLYSLDNPVPMVAQASVNRGF